MQTESPAAITDPLEYETVSVHPGRMRITETADELQIDLIQRPAREVIPRALFYAIAAVAVGLLLEFGLFKLGHHRWLTQGAALLVVVQSIGLMPYFVDYDRVHLTFRVNPGGVTIVGKHPLNSWRHHLALADLKTIEISGTRKKRIKFVAQKGGYNLWIARKPQHVTEIYTRLNQAVETLRSR